MKLYYTPGSSATAVRIALAIAGLPYEAERVNLAEKTTASGKDFLTINPRGYVPALELDSGKILVETAAILAYVWEKSQTTPPSLEDRMETYEWLSYISSEFHAVGSMMYAAREDEGAKKVITAKVTRRMGFVESYFSQHEYCGGGTQPGIPDAYLAFALTLLSRLGFDLSAYPNTHGFVERLLAQETVRKVLQEETSAM